MEKQLEIQSSIIEASKVLFSLLSLLLLLLFLVACVVDSSPFLLLLLQTLLEQANNRKLKKDRKKEIKKMENKYQEIEQRLHDLRRQNTGGSTLSGGTRFYGDSPG